MDVQRQSQIPSIVILGGGRGGQIPASAVAATKIAKLQTLHPIAAWAHADRKVEHIEIGPTMALRSP